MGHGRCYPLEDVTPTCSRTVSKHSFREFCTKNTKSQITDFVTL